METEELVQIGDLGRRVGVTVETLRAWERRYGLLRPRRSPGGFRLYSERDEATVRAMLAEIGRGFPPAQAAKLALARYADATADPRPQGAVDSGALDAARHELRIALTGYHEGRAHQVLDRLLAEFTVDSLLDQVVLPLLHDLGDGWARGDVTVAQEHFASNVLRERLLNLARPWDRGGGPHALLACPPEERHDIGLICFGVTLGRAGWSVTFLGADTPVGTLADAATVLAPDLVVLTSTMDGRLDPLTAPVRRLAKVVPVALAGQAVTPALARSAGGLILPGSPVDAANQIVTSGIGSLAPVRAGTSR